MGLTLHQIAGIRNRHSRAHTSSPARPCRQLSLDVERRFVGVHRARHVYLRVPANARQPHLPPAVDRGRERLAVGDRVVVGATPVDPRPAGQLEVEVVGDVRQAVDAPRVLEHALARAGAVLSMRKRQRGLRLRARSRRSRPPSRAAARATIRLPRARSAWRARAKATARARSRWRAPAVDAARSRLPGRATATAPSRRTRGRARAAPARQARRGA